MRNQLQSIAPIVAGLILILTAALTVAADIRKFDDEVYIEEEIGASGFLGLAELAQMGSAAERARFAVVALDQMMLAYGLELEAVHEMPPETLDREERVLRWEASTSNYVERLIRAAKLVEQNNDVKVLIQPGGSVMLVVEDVSVMVSTPRLAEQTQLERRIAEMLCPETHCTMLVHSIQLVEQSVRVLGRWETTDGTTFSYRTADGWRCEFAAADQNESKARICQTTGERNSAVGCDHQDPGKTETHYRLARLRHIRQCPEFTTPIADQC